MIGATFSTPISWTSSSCSFSSRRSKEARAVLHPEQLDEVGEILVVDLFEELAERRRVLVEELTHLGGDGDRDADHGPPYTRPRSVEQTIFSGHHAPSGASCPGRALTAVEGSATDRP